MIQSGVKWNCIYLTHTVSQSFSATDSPCETSVKALSTHHTVSSFIAIILILGVCILLHVRDQGEGGGSSMQS
jgi:hypothetical protein